MSETRINEDRLLQRYSFAAVHLPPPGVIRSDVAALLAEINRLRELAKTCICTPPPHGEGIEPDCPVHGAIRVLNKRNAEVRRLEVENDALKVDRAIDLTRLARLQQIIDDIREYAAAADQRGYGYVSVKHLRWFMTGRPERDIAEDYEQGGPA
jgi:hypothetical protein